MLMQFFPRSLLNISLATGVTLIAVLSTVSAPVEAITLITNRDDLGATDFVNWSSLGKLFPPTLLSPPGTPTSVSAISQKGLELTAGIPAISPPILSPLVFQTLPTFIPTNFASGDFILFTGLQPGVGTPAPGNPGPLTITFNQPVWGVGTQIAVDDALNPYTVFIQAFDSNNNLLGEFDRQATSSIILDNSAVFLGVRSELPNISKLVYRTSITTQGFGINNLGIVATPEPTSILGILLISFLGISSKIKQKD